MVESIATKKVINPISPGSIITIACRMLKNINKHILFHNERTAFIALHIARRLNLGKSYSITNIVILALFHTIGFFKDDGFFGYSDSDSLKDLLQNNHETESKYVFGCYYLQYMTPLKKESLALETFYQSYNQDLDKFTYEEVIKSIIYFSARISDFIVKNPDQPLPQDLNSIAPNQFNPTVVKAFEKINQNDAIVNQIKSREHLTYLYNYIQKITMTDREKNQYLKLLVYILDFKSTSTMSHSINTACYALSLGLRFDLSQDMISELFVSALLHDIGKICTPQRILEASGGLSPEEMGIMRHHVNHSKRMVQDLVNEQILQNIYRHHEKLNGSGYPSKLNKNDISLVQRIITIADITSALSDSRSYKEKYDPEKTLGIINNMAEKGELDVDITNILTKNFTQIENEVTYLRKPLQADFSKILMKYNDFLFSDSLIENFEILEEPIEEI